VDVMAMAINIDLLMKLMNIDCAVVGAVDDTMLKVDHN